MYDERSYYSMVESFARKYPKRNDGRIDYTNADEAAVCTIFVMVKDKILLLRRSEAVLTYKGKWNTVAGYLDEIVPLEEKIIEELQEELGIHENEIDTIRIGDSYTFIDTKIQKTWIVYPAVASLNRDPDITLDWEHSEYTWIHPDTIDLYDTVPNAKESLRRSLHEL